MPDPTEGIRRAMVSDLNLNGIPEDYEGPLWDTAQLRLDFDVVGFLAPFVQVRRKSDGAKGTLMFTHNPRWYFNWKEA